MNDLAGAAYAVEEATLPRRYAAVRAWTEHLAASLSDEDQCVQSMPDASPAKWHRAHTTWFFEQFVLTALVPDYQAFDRDFLLSFQFLLRGCGPAASASESRPADAAVRRRVSARSAIMSMPQCSGFWRVCPTRPPGLSSSACSTNSSIRNCCSPTCCMRSRRARWRPPCCRTGASPQVRRGPTRFVDCPGGMARIGQRGAAFCFDNETPAT